MLTLAATTLDTDERELIARYVADLRERFRDELHAVWLFGSRARGEQPSEDSDIDLLVLVDDASWDGRMLVRKVLDESARQLGLEALPWSFSVHVHTPRWLAERREIKSFFVAELDRDKVPLDQPT